MIDLIEQRMEVHIVDIHDAMAANEDMRPLIKKSLSLRDEYFRAGKSMQDWDALCGRLINVKHEE